MIQVSGQDGFTSRREFSFALASGADLAINGYLTGQASSPPVDQEDDRPVLAGDMYLQPDPTGLRLLRDGAVCGRVNPVGAQVLAGLNGQRTIREIAAGIARTHGIPLSEVFASRIAGFVTELNTAGFLARPLRSGTSAPDCAGT